MRKLYEKIRALMEMPHIGRPEFLFSPMPYIVVYTVREQTIEIWRIWHTSQSRGS